MEDLVIIDGPEGQNCSSFILI